MLKTIIIKNDMGGINFSELRASADKATALMKVMANTDRLILLCQLSGGEKSVGELEAILDIKQPTLSQQLAVLRDAELVKTRREGKNIFYSISSDSAMAVMQVLHQQICGIKNSVRPNPQQLNDFLSANSQISTEDVATLATQGFKTIITLRPDAEDDGKHASSTEIATACQNYGIAHHYLPVIPGNITPENVATFEQICGSSAKPIFAYCKTGGRASNISRMCNLEEPRVCAI